MEMGWKVRKRKRRFLCVSFTEQSHLLRNIKHLPTEKQFWLESKLPSSPDHPATPLLVHVLLYLRSGSSKDLQLFYKKEKGSKKLI